MSFFRDLRRFPFLMVIITAALIAAVVIFLERTVLTTDQPAITEKSRTAEPRAVAADPEVPKHERPGPGGDERQIAVIIDDIGFDLRTVEELARIEAPVAFAILPNTPHATEAARVLHAEGREILLHLPMEPHSYPAEDPGRGALFVDMGDAAIARQVEKDLAVVPHAFGVNNHMGSRFMEDEVRLSIVMKELSKRGLFFVDSLTTPRSRARTAAARAGVRFAARVVFIDHEPGYASALANLIDPPRQGWEPGKPILMIGHPHPATIRALRDASSHWQADGVRMIPVSACVSVPGGREGTMQKSDDRQNGDRKETVR